MGFEALPSDLIFEILSRTSLETLERCKAVSKSWKQMIYEATFLPLHCKRTNSLFGYFFQNMRYNKYTSALVSSGDGAASAAAVIKGSWPCNEMKILASCDQGILCCQRRICYNYRYYACKPATNQWQALPNPKLRYQTATVAVAVVQSHPLRYIIARLSNNGMQYNCEIFDSEIWAWEKLKCLTPYGEIVSPNHSAVTIAGQFVHWLTYNDNVLTLDIKKRRLRCSPLPETLRGNSAYKWKQAVEYEGGLGFACLMEDKDIRQMEVWAAERKVVVVDMKAVGKVLHDPLPVEFCSSDVVFMTTDDGAVFYNIQNGKFSRVEVPYNLRSPRKIFRFRSDLEIVDLRCGGR